MNNKLLLPNKFKKLGWILLIPSSILAILTMYSGQEIKWLNANVFSILPEFSIGAEPKYFQVIEANLGNTIVGVFFIIGALLVSFSKEKIEDEFIAHIRLSSLMWAVLINYILLLVAFLLIYDVGFLSVMIFNMFTVLIIFIVRFHYMIYKNSTFKSDEK